VTPDIFPWQTQQWQQLIASKQQNRLPHAILLMGAKGLGKHQFALSFAHALLCEKLEAPCGECRACYFISAQSHPDLLRVEPLQLGGMIKIDQIRELVKVVSETTSQGGMRIVIIHPAHAMNSNAANALLKTLEEPAPNTLIILISEQNLRLSATILSRCQKILFQKPSSELALNWLHTQLLTVSKNEVDKKILLNLADGAPLKAKEWAEQGWYDLRQALYQNLIALTQRQADPLQLAIYYQEQALEVILTLILTWLQDLLRFKLTQGQATLINVDYRADFEKLVQCYSKEKLLDYLEHVKKIYAYIINSLNLNRQLLLEELFIRWVQYATC